MLKYLLFDLDGTLIDSSRCIFKVYTDLFNQLGIPVPDNKTLRTFIGPPIEEVIVRYYDGELKPVCNQFRDLYSKVDLKENNILYPNVKEMLDTLKNDGYVMCIASTKYYVYVEKILGLMGITDCFDIVAGSNAKAGIVGKKDVLNSLFARGVEKDKCVLIGDTIFDVEGAKEVNIPVAIVKYGFGVAKDFEKEQIIWYADTVMDIVDRVRNTILERK